MTDDEKADVMVEAFRPYVPTRRQTMTRDDMIQREEDGYGLLDRCGCGNCEKFQHASDCAVHNMPAKPNDFCNCGVTRWCARCGQPFDGDETADGCRDPECPETELGRHVTVQTRKLGNGQDVRVWVPNDHPFIEMRAVDGDVAVCYLCGGSADIHTA